jgi:WD40 repeat protein
VKTRSVLILFLLLILSACSTQYISKTETPAVYSIDGIPLRPGAVSWSPDSTRLALMKNEQLVLFDYTTGISRRIPEISPVFLEWAPGGRVVALREKGAGREIIMLDARKGTYHSIPPDESTEAVRWLNPPDELVALSTDIKRLTIGTFVTYKLTLVKGMDRKVVFQKELYLPTRRQDREFTSAWLFPGIRPVHETVLIPEYHNPPVVHPYTYFRTVDPVTGLEEDIMKLDSRRFNVLASWSPDGSRLAVSNDEGLLIIADAGDPAGNGMPVSYEITGLRPSWNPKGSQIYLGGWLIRSDGEVVGELLSDAFNSIGLWSPDGEKLAVMTESKTFIFDSIHPSFHAPDSPLDNELLTVRDKLRLLKDLLKDGLILNSEFHARRAKLFEKIGGEGK